MKKTIKYGSHSILQVLIVAGILIFVNIIALRVYGRLDMTEDGRYTLSESTKKILADLDDILTITCYFTKDLPPQATPIRTAVEDLLDEYRANSGGKLQIVLVDPSTKEGAAKARADGVSELLMNVSAKDKVETVKIYLGVVFKYEDRREAIAAIMPQNLQNLEYEFSSLILKVATPEVKTVGFWFGHEPDEAAAATPPERHSLAEGYRLVKNALEKNYRVRMVDITGGREVPEDVNALVVAGPRKTTEAEQYEIDQYIMRGGDVIFLLDTYERNRMLLAFPRPSGLEPLLRSYGADLRPKLIFDSVCAMAAFRQGGSGVQFSFMRPYPYWPKVRQENLDRTIPATRGIDSLIFPWTSPVEPFEPLPEGVTATKVARTSEQAWTPAVDGRLSLNPEQLQPPAQPPGKYTHVLALQGRFKSFFAGKPLPKATGRKGEVIPDPDLPYKNRQTAAESTEESRIVVIGSSDFISDTFSQFLPRMEERNFSQNLIFFQNLVDWLAMGESLIDIRIRDIGAAPLEPVEESKKSLIKSVNFFGVPLLILAYGLLQWSLRRREKRIFEEGFQEGSVK